MWWIDLRLVAVSCPSTTLAAGEIDDLHRERHRLPGQYTNLAVARGLTPLGDQVRDLDPSHYFGAAPGVNIEKDTNGVDADTPPEGPFIPVGDPVRWTYIVTNTGNIPLTGIDVADDQGVTVDLPRRPPWPPDES